jgi:hypothetical protein
LTNKAVKSNLFCKSIQQITKINQPKKIKMKNEAVIRKSKFDEVKEALHKIEVNFFTYWMLPDG